MSAYGQFIKIEILSWMQANAEKAMDQIEPKWRDLRPTAWAGIAAEYALEAAEEDCRIWRAGAYDHDLELQNSSGTKRLKIEVKTRAVSDGWTDPRLFEWLVVPTHDGREPVKQVDHVWFCWHSGSDPATLWVLGYLLGLPEFKRRSIFYHEGQPLPRGGWADKGGAYCLHVNQLRPFPPNLFKEKK